LPPSNIADGMHPKLMSSGRSIVLGTIGTLLASAIAATSAFAAPAPTVTETFSSTGAEQQFVVPTGVGSIRVRAIGGAGETGHPSFRSFGAPGGAGADVVSRIPVTPGEVLYVEVAAAGFNGGGVGGFEGGGVGGGSSDIRSLAMASPGSLESRLLVAAGGGGGGGGFDEGVAGRGGDAGSAGTNSSDTERFGPFDTNSQGGATGTLTGGGAGGAQCEGFTGPWNGTEGGLGAGGIGGEEFGAPETGGGGGGAGYWGGGGGEGSCPSGGPESAGAGGGGGSSFVFEGGTNSSFGLASPSTPATVSITYATPATATPDVSAITFADPQPLQTVSPPQTVTITNGGGNPLKISSALFADASPALSTDHPQDFLIDSSSCLSQINFEESCKLTVRFAPQASGTQTATLQIASNAAVSPTVTTLTGTGGTLPQGPAGAPGPSGLNGPAGASGKPGATGPTAVYVCHRRKGTGKYVIACFVRILSARHDLTSATLMRHGVVYARATSGALTVGHQLVLEARRRVSAGRYTLILVSKSATTRQTITVG
jgi:hypothetical protein